MKAAHRRFLSSLKLPRHKLILDAFLLVLTLLAALLLWQQPWKPQTASLPPAVVERIASFQPYYFTPDIPGNFKLDEQSVRYEQGILFFHIRNASRGQTITVTEQLLPPTLADEPYNQAKKVDGVDGLGMINYDGTRITGGLFSAKQKGGQTLVILNSTDPIPQVQVEDMLRALRPIKSN